MSKHSNTQKHAKQSKSSKPADAGSPQGEQSHKEGPACHSGHVQTTEKGFPGQTDEDHTAVDVKRSDEKQYHAAGASHDPHDRLQEQVDRGDPDAGDLDEETRSDSAPFNKTYGRRQ